MSPAVNSESLTAATSGSRSSLVRAWLPVLLFSLLWIDLVRQLSYTWETNEQYAYGWFVPILALALFFRRWPTRPNPQPSTFNLQFSVLAVLLCFLLLPLRVIHEINQDWPLIAWPLTLVVVALSFLGVFLAGGWRWVNYFSFPICFILVAVQWPYRIENGLTQSLMQVVAGSTVEIIGWFGVPALRRGNLIEISSGVLGVDEACSGIRSFQSTLMVSLFLGELYRLRWPIRALLVGAGLVVAFLLNLCRTLLLTWQANAHGLSAIDKWHDPAGFTIAVACFAVLWLLAVVIKKRWPVSHIPSSTLDTLDTQPSTPHPRPGLDSQLSILNSPIAVRHYLLATGCWAVFCFLATEVWYRGHDARRSETARWWVNYPTNESTFKAVTVPKAAAKLLKHDVESGGNWNEPDGAKWIAYCFRWKEGNPTARMSAQGHRPEYCLVGSGYDLIDMSEIKYLDAHGMSLPFRFYTFDQAAGPVHVFFCLWEDGAESQVGFGKTKQGDRLRTVWAGRRGLGQQTFEIICQGYSDMAAAEQAVRRRLPELIRVENQREVNVVIGL